MIQFVHRCRLMSGRFVPNRHAMLYISYGSLLILVCHPQFNVMLQVELAPHVMVNSCTGRVRMNAATGAFGSAKSSSSTSSSKHRRQLVIGFYIQW